jgi:hypothetical protein
MENSNPYEYEKPLKSFASKRVKGFTALGVVAITSALGGGAIASGLSAQSGNQASLAGSAKNQMTPVVADNSDTVLKEQSFGEVLMASFSAIPQFFGSDAVQNSQAQFGTSATASRAKSQVIDIPIDSVVPNKSSGTILLPDLKLPSWGNTSSATPSAGSPSSATGSNISSVQSSSYENEDENDDDRKSSRHENKSESRESDDEQDDD